MSDWQPIETAPKDGSTILLCVSNSEREPVIVTGLWVTEAMDWSGWPITEPTWREVWCHFQLASDGDNPTHWMPLPTPPQS